MRFAPNRWRTVAIHVDGIPGRDKSAVSQVNPIPARDAGRSADLPPAYAPGKRRVIGERHHRSMRRLTGHGQSWLDMAMRRIGVAELKDNLSRELRAVEAGETIEVLDRSRPIARIVPIVDPPAVTIRPPVRPFSEIRDRTYPPANWSVDSLTLLREERRERLP